MTDVAAVGRDDLWRTIADAAGNMVGDFAPNATVDHVVDAILANPDVVLRALGGLKVGQEALTPNENKWPVECDVWAFLPREK